MVVMCVLESQEEHNEVRRFLYATWTKVPKSSFHSKNSDFVAGRPIDTPGTPLLALNLRPFLLLCSLFPSCEKTQEWGRETGVERRGWRDAEGHPRKKYFFLRGFGRTRDRRDREEAARWPSLRSKKGLLKSSCLEIGRGQGRGWEGTPAAWLGVGELGAPPGKAKRHFHWRRGPPARRERALRAGA